MRGLVFSGVIATGIWLSGHADTPDASEIAGNVPLPGESRNFVLSSSSHRTAACQVKLTGAADAGEIMSDTDCLAGFGIGESRIWRFAASGDIVFADASGKATMQFAEDEIDGYLSINRSGALLQLIRR